MKIRGSPSISSSNREPLVSISDNACSTIPAPTSKSFTAASLSFSRGRAQCPSEVASSKTWSMPAFARLGEVPRNPDLLRDLVGGREANPVDVLRQRVGIAPHLLDCLLAVGLEDSHSPAGAHAMAVQEQHDFPYLLCLLPCVRDPLPALGADAIDRLQFGGSVLDHGEHLGSEPPDQLLRENRPDALDQAAAEVSLDPLGGGGRHRLHGRRLELQPVFLIQLGRAS